jgi:hypothetical protein
MTCEELDEKDCYRAIMEAHNVFKKKADAKKGEEWPTEWVGLPTQESKASSTEIPITANN